MSYEGIFELLSQIPYYSIITTYIDETFLRIFILTLALFGYGIICWKFYSTLAKRDLFKVKLASWMSKKEKFGEILLFVLKYTVIFPLYTFFWFILFSFFLIILAKSISISEIFFFSIVMISFTRAAAYYEEDLARSVAEVIPITLFVVFFTEPSFISIQTLISRWNEFMASFPNIFSYLLFSIYWEWFLRIIYFIKLKIFKTYGDEFVES